MPSFRAWISKSSLKLSAQMCIRDSIRTESANDRRLLLIKDSYANCFVPFLTPYYREIVMVDPRYYYGDIEELIGEKQISDVLFLYNANTFFGDNSLHDVLNRFQ